jgi:hypothetical protein
MIEKRNLLIKRRGAKVKRTNDQSDSVMGWALIPNRQGLMLLQDM